MRASLFLLFMCSCSPINKEIGIQDDHPLEEFAEHIIQVETGLNIDLSPQSEEN